MFRFVFQTLALVLLASAGCKGSVGSFGGERIAFQTRLGDVVIALYPEIAPFSSQHILNVAAAGLYTTNTLAAAEGRKVVLTGSCLRDRKAHVNPVQKHLVDRQLPLEVDTRFRHSAGEVSVATLDAVNATNRLMFMLEDTAAFDTKQTVVGHVITGMDVLREIASLGDRQGDARATSRHVSIDSVYLYSAVDVGPQPHPIHMARGVERESVQKQETFFWSACAACHRQTVEINKRLHAARMVLREARLGQKKGPYSSSWAAQLGYRQKTALLPPEL